MPETDVLQASFNSFSGADIHATFAGTRVGTLQGISFTVTREKAPIYTMGRSDPRGFSRGKRGIAGSLIFAVFDRTNLLLALDTDQLNFVASVEDIRRGSSLGRVEYGANLLMERDADLAGDGSAELRPSWYHDQIPPFDITLVAINEYGHLAKMEILGVEILNAGSGVSIDDIVTDENMTFVARTIIPWMPLRTIQGSPATKYAQKYNAAVV